MANIKRLMIIGAGFLSLFIGIIFILVPGPAVIFMPLGLALLSLEFAWAKRALKTCQRWMRKSAVKMDNLVASVRARH